MRPEIIRMHIALFALIAAISPGIGLASDDAQARLRSELISPWLVEVEGEARPRTLLIRSAELGRDGVFELDALYGWSDTRQTKVNAQASIKTEGHKLVLTTQANSIVAADSSGPGLMTGTFTPSSGSSKTIKLTRLAPDALAQAVKNALDAAKRSLVKPGAEVPAECAGLFGGWKGQWGNGYGEEWLWVVRVDANCIAKYRYKPDGFWGPFFTGEIKNGVLSTPCGSGGTCSFQRREEKLWGNWHGPSGSNTIVLESIPMDAK